MKWIAVLLMFGIAYGQDLPARVAGSPPANCEGADPTVNCFHLDGTLPEVEARITTNVQALDLGTGEWFDTMESLFDGWNVEGPSPDGVRYTAFGTDEVWFLVMASNEDGVIIVNLTEAWDAQP